jgi:probable biosynthetic protein (TIGR04098 family)
LNENYIHARYGNQVSEEGSTALQIREIVARMARVPEHTVDTTYSATRYGIDSLALLELREMIERSLHVHLPDDVWVKFQSLNDIVRYVDRSKQSHSFPPAIQQIAQVHVQNGQKNATQQLTNSGTLYDEIEIGMPMTGRNNLAETPLLKYLGDLRWKHLTAVCGVPSKLFADAEGSRLYPTFFYVDLAFPQQKPMAAYGENDRIRVASTMKRFGTSMLDGESYLLPVTEEKSDNAPFSSIAQALAAGVPAVRMSNIFVKQFGGAEWLKKSRPAHPEFERIPEMAVAPDSYAAAKQAEKDGYFALPDSEYVPMTDGPVTVVYRLIPDRDLNGAGLVYFANYPMFLDICEREVLRDARLPLTDELIDRRTIVRRKSAYLNNASSKDMLEIQIEPWVQNPIAAGNPAPDMAPIRLIVNARMVRKSDGRVMMISTVEKIIFGRAMEEAPFFEQLVRAQAPAARDGL